MGSFKIYFLPAAEKEFRAVPFPFRRQINQRIMRLKEEPFPADAELITEAEKYRLPVHGWRIIFKVEDARGLVTIVAVLKA